jgi:RNase P subunit RPR2
MSLVSTNKLIQNYRGEVIKVEVEGYCVKCKEKHMMKDAQEITMKNGKPAVTGTCESCGTKMFKIGGVKKA